MKRTRGVNSLIRSQNESEVVELVSPIPFIKVVLGKFFIVMDELAESGESKRFHLIQDERIVPAESRIIHSQLSSGMNQVSRKT